MRTVVTHALLGAALFAGITLGSPASGTSNDPTSTFVLDTDEEERRGYFNAGDTQNKWTKKRNEFPPGTLLHGAQSYTDVNNVLLPDDVNASQAATIVTNMRNGMLGLALTMGRLFLTNAKTTMEKDRMWGAAPMESYFWKWWPENGTTAPWGNHLDGCTPVISGKEEQWQPPNMIWDEYKKAQYPIFKLDEDEEFVGFASAGRDAPFHLLFVPKYPIINSATIDTATTESTEKIMKMLKRMQTKCDEAFDHFKKLLTNIEHNKPSDGTKNIECIAKSAMYVPPSIWAKGSYYKVPWSQDKGRLDFESLKGKSAINDNTEAVTLVHLPHLFSVAQLHVHCVNNNAEEIPDFAHELQGVINGLNNNLENLRK